MIIQDTMSVEPVKCYRRTDISSDHARFQTDGRHISAPFDLRHDFSSLSKPDNWAFFNETFPRNEGYAHDDHFLYIFLSEPPQPIPKSFAGVLVLFVQSVSSPAPLPPAMILPQGHWIPSKQGRIATHLDYTDKKDFAWEPLFEEIRAHFQSLAIAITEVIYFGHFVYIVLEDQDTDMTKLPRMAAAMACMYMFEHEMHRPAASQALPRINDAGHGVAVDDSNYNVLQPGVKICSDFLPHSQASLSTTLGACVRDQDGNHYITVAAHGFSNTIGAGVFHPRREDGRLIGHMTKRIGNTGVGLVSLCPGESFANETFASAGNDSSSLLAGLGTAKKFDFVAMDSPYTGYIDGQIMATSRREIPDEDDWVANDWMYKSQSSSELLPDSVRGSIVYDVSSYKVLSFFEYEIKEGPWKGWCVGTSATELLKRGYA